MTNIAPTLHLLCGKIGSGKSTLAAELSNAPATLVISEDAWLSALFSDQMTSGADYVSCSKKLQNIMTTHVAALLNTGVSVVLDFAANTVIQRQWMRDIILQTGAAHQMHVLDVPDAVCLERLRARNAAGTHEFAATDEQFHQFAKYFVAPTEEEGFNIVRH